MVGAAIGAGIGAVSAWAAGGSGRDIAAAAAGGAVTGALAAATCGLSLGAEVGGGALAGTAGYYAEHLVSGKETSVTGAALSAAGGAAGAMAGELINSAVSTASNKLAQAAASVKKSPYANLTDSQSVGSGKSFTAAQKRNILAANAERNGGTVKSDLSGKTLVPPVKSTKDVTPSADEWQMDHIIPKSKGGTNSYTNAQILSRQENRAKWDN